MKFLKIFPFTFIFLMLTNVNVSFASSSISDLPPVPKVEGYNHAVIYESKNLDNYVLIYHNADSIIYYRANEITHNYADKQYNTLGFNESHALYYYLYDGKWEYDSDRYISDFNCSYKSELKTLSPSHIVCTDVNIVYKDGSSFFLATPISGRLYFKISGAQMMNRAILPMVYLAPLLIIFVVALIAFRKGWNFLRDQL